MLPLCSMADGSLQPRDRTACASCGRAPLEAMQDAHARMLRRMAEIVLDVAEAVRGEVMAAQAEPAPAAAPAAEPEAPAAPVRMSRLAGADVGLTLSRLSRSLRLTLALERRFADAERSFVAEARAQGLAEEDAAAQAEAAWREQLDEARQTKQQAIQIVKTMAVEQLTDKGVPEAEIDRESLFAELNEKLADDSDLELLVDYGLRDLVGLLCQGMGLPFDWREYKSDLALRNEWLDELPPEPPAHPGWAKGSGPGP
jgi:hypothetical protein